MRRTLLSAVVVLAIGVSLSALPAAHSEDTAVAVSSLVRVHTPTDADRGLLTNLGLDLTEHGGDGFVDVVLHGAADADVLRAAGLEFDVLVPDLVAQEEARIEADAAFAAANPTTALPSGRHGYRTLEDYENEMEYLATRYPNLVEPFSLPERTVEGRDVLGIEVAANAGADDGRPVMVMLGLHHVREWPSGELTMEFARDLVQSYGTDDRITRLLNEVRVLFVPVVNPDGFHASRTDGDRIDLRRLGEPENDPTGLGQTAVVYGNPGNTYKRKNCRIVNGMDTPTGMCALPTNRFTGVDLNRNYGANWGGNGASAVPTDDTYRGPGPFSEPETRNIQALVSSHQVTMLITNHTYSNLVLRPPGVRAFGFHPEDELAMEDIGDRMAAQNGYTSQHGWELYDTTGTTEDWSYLATGGFGYTFEIGANEFHPPFAEVVDEYLGAGAYAGRGNREAFLIALEEAANPAHHSVISGRAPAGAVLRISRTAVTTTSPVQLAPTLLTDDPGIATGAVIRFEDHVESTMVVVDRNGRFAWHVNPSTRPLVDTRVLPPAEGRVVRTETYENSEPTQPGDHIDVPFTVAAAHDGLQLDAVLDWPTPDDYDIVLYRVNDDGSLSDVTSSGEPPGFKEHIVVDRIAAGDYVFRVTNFAAVGPTWTLTTELLEPGPSEVVLGTFEAWTLTCERNGVVQARQGIVVERGQTVPNVDFSDC